MQDYILPTCVSRSQHKRNDKICIRRKQFNKSILNFGQYAMLLTAIRNVSWSSIVFDYAKKFDNEKNIPFTDIASQNYFALKWYQELEIEGYKLWVE